MTHGTLGGLIISDLMLGVENPWTELYSPKRIQLQAAGTFISQQLNVLAQYGDYISKADIGEIDELGAGEGAILGKGLKKYAVYRDDTNAIHAFSAVCPHLGCVVHWNNDEKSFDCPCHGSRFTKEGVVINGPAQEKLKKLEVK